MWPLEIIFGYAKGENVMGKLVGVLHRLGFDEVYDTSYGADLTVVEESKEFIERFTSGQKCHYLHPAVLHG